MDATTLISAKKELRKLQKTLGAELAKGKYKDTRKIIELKMIFGQKSKSATSHEK